MHHESLSYPPLPPIVQCWLGQREPARAPTAHPSRRPKPTLDVWGVRGSWSEIVKYSPRWLEMRLIPAVLTARVKALCMSKLHARMAVQKWMKGRSLHAGVVLLDHTRPTDGRLFRRHRSWILLYRSLFAAAEWPIARKTRHRWLPTPSPWQQHACRWHARSLHCYGFDHSAPTYMRTNQ